MTDRQRTSPSTAGNHRCGAPLARGFTLIEVLIGVAIIAILVTVALPSYSSVTVRVNGPVNRGPVEDEDRRRTGEEGLVVGRLVLRPYVTASWIDADILAFDSPTSVRDQYLQVAPGVTASVPVGNGLLAAEYEPRLRFFSDIPLVNETSHFAGARLEMPIGSRTLVRLSHRVTTAILETTVVDPGREYFLDLSRYTFHEPSGAARVDLGARLFAEG